MFGLFPSSLNYAIDKTTDGYREADVLKLQSSHLRRKSGYNTNHIPRPGLVETCSGRPTCDYAIVLCEAPPGIRCGANIGGGKPAQRLEEVDTIERADGNGLHGINCMPELQWFNMNFRSLGCRQSQVVGVRKLPPMMCYAGKLLRVH